jgi:hypothetical protein
LTEAVKPKFAELGLLEFAALPSDADINWAALEAPMPTLRPQRYSGIEELVVPSAPLPRAAGG